MRKPMVTRTIQTTVATVLCVDLIHAEPFNKDVILPRTYKDEKTMMKRIREIVDTDETKAVHIVNYYVDEQLYGMTEDTFIENAEKLPPRGSSEDEDSAEDSEN